MQLGQDPPISVHWHSIMYINVEVGNLKLFYLHNIIMLHDFCHSMSNFTFGGFQACFQRELILVVLLSIPVGFKTT